MSGETACASSRDWDAATYDRVSDVQFAWALEQLERLPLRGDEVVLDAGCGSGRVTAQLVERVPQGRVYGVDVAPSMVAHARAGLGEAATILRQDLVALDLPEPVDVVFSNATFHWIDDHDALFAGLHRVLKPQGRLVAQCGGTGNVGSFLAAVRSVAAQEPFPQRFAERPVAGRFAGDEETASRLRDAGFSQVSCWLVPKPVTPPEPHQFIKTVCLVRHLESLPPDLHDLFVERVLEAMGEPPVLDYVRLNMTASRP